jgi:hypothetical protein
MDLCQQVRFLDQLGKTEEAIDTLERHIKEGGKNAPLLFLELLQIANARSLKTDFRQFRDEFQEIFNCNVPEFALFRDQGKSLEAYPAVMSPLTKVWGTPKMLEILESCILRDPWEKNPATFDIAAFKDLVSLHGIARYQLLHPNHTPTLPHPLEAELSQQHIDLDI